ncbi:MAG: 2-oxoacid:acceptor oxidoreductase subunit alpha [Anaerolineae bacterium]|nr:MAG: 2-oxoacid:acceptor oxidoreductase subunit alpha [Anaerolineae bacterium]
MTQRIVNDFSITVGTPNGSGSSTANNTILRALFKMGIPVSGKNLFPSNIQGLPTWYTIRVNKDGFIARRASHEIMVAMNPNSFTRDLADVAPGGAFFYADDIKLPINRSDISIYPMPVKQLVRSNPEIPANLRDLVANMVYVGILAHMIGIDIEKIKLALKFHFKNKEKPIALNMSMVKAGAEWAAANLTKTDPFYVEPMNKTEGLIMADGNTAAALGAIYGGVQFASWYPITPASSLAESLNEYLPMLRRTPEGKNTFAVVQAEDELAAIGMCVGAGWAGLRAMTSTSGPGMSLMTEYAGLAYFAEVPLVIWDVQRMGPSTGLPTRTSQGDVAFVANMGHGDIDSLILLPGSIKECFEFGWRAFDIAERLQTPVYVLSDLDFGMNQWMSEPFEYPNVPMDRGKVLWEEDLEQLKGDWGRYRDVDGDGIPYRTLPGNTHPASAYFTRGTGHTPEARYSEEPHVWVAKMERLKKKYETAKQYLPRAVIQKVDGAKFGIIAFGSTDPAVEEARAYLEQEHGLKSDYLRLRAIPFTEDVSQFIAEHERVYVVEINRDGQLQQLLSIKHPQHATRLVPIAYSDGLPPTAQWIWSAILEQEEK